MKVLLREPLLHFVLLGAGLFAAYAWFDRQDEGPTTRIIVSAGRIEHLAVAFQRTWQRPPTSEELKGLIDQFVREEVLSREASKLGLDRDDAIIRRRLEQKMQFLAEDAIALETPADADLGRYLTGNPGKFRVDPTYTFAQVYLSPDRHREDLDTVAAQLLAELKVAGAGANFEAFGDPSLLPSSFEQESHGRIDSTFGTGFAARLAEVPLGQWSGPLSSGLGVHLVLVTGRTEDFLPPLEEIRDSVLREWTHERRTEMNRLFLDKLLEQYEIVVEQPGAAPAPAPLQPP